MSFMQWDGQTPVDAGSFDLIVSKMVLHYLNLEQLDTAAHNLISILAPGGELAISAPCHRLEEVRSGPLVLPITTQIGQTGVRATMYDYSVVGAVVSAYTPEDYGFFVDYVKDEGGEYKRADTLLFPRDKFRKVRRRLIRAGISNGDYDAEMCEFFTDQLRSVGGYIVSQAMANDTGRHDKDIVTEP